MAQPKGRVAYEPNSLSEDSPREAADGGFVAAVVTETGEKGRIRAESFADHYSQARLFYVSQTPPEQAHIASALVFELSKVEHPHMREAMVGHLRHIDEDLARRVAEVSAWRAAEGAGRRRPSTIWSPRRRCSSSAR